MFYATAIYQDDEVLVNDLFRFKTKTERDNFVEERDYAESITRKEAEQEYKEQFAYWKQND
ncbi:hypothetical protein HWA77_16805 [Photobacterium damselae subsp. damselae]|uniref:Uncharacterized protein n=1 Tax=Photobacterium damselae subsp. damselae TaxID=85581 RepID=A0A850QTA3_PHODD|nr:hypothetical protein [Photobacterium damselae subsp. damselae]